MAKFPFVKSFLVKLQKLQDVYIVCGGELQISATSTQQSFCLQQQQPFALIF